MSKPYLKLVIAAAIVALFMFGMIGPMRNLGQTIANFKHVSRGM